MSLPSTLVLAASFAFLPGCALFGQSDANSYRYTAFDDAGVKIESGTLTLVFSPSSSRDHAFDLSGSWRFASVDGDTTETISTGSGQLEGWVDDDDAFSFDIHPGYADYNFVLSGSSLTDGAKTFSGRWEALGFAGIIATGTFTATQ